MDAQEPTEAAPALAYKLEWNDDGSAIVKLRDPIRRGDEELSRLTIPALRGKHLRLIGWGAGENPSVGKLADFAAAVVLPAGAFDELDIALSRDIAQEVGLALGKARKTGGARSPT